MRRLLVGIDRQHHRITIGARIDADRVEWAEVFQPLDRLPSGGGDPARLGACDGNCECVVLAHASHEALALTHPRMERIMRGVGTDEPMIEDPEEAAMLRSTRQWRKPLRIDEVNRMAPTPEVRARQGRP